MQTKVERLKERWKTRTASRGPCPHASILRLVGESETCLRCGTVVSIEIDPVGELGA